jgi:hypothetical protein
MLVYARFKNAYLVCKKAYAKQLLLSNTISTMMLNGFGDIFCQFIEYKLAKNKNVDDYAKNSENSSIVQSVPNDRGINITDFTGTSYESQHPFVNFTNTSNTFEIWINI